MSVFPNRPTLHHPCWGSGRRTRPNKAPNPYNRHGYVCTIVRLHRRKLQATSRWDRPQTTGLTPSGRAAGPITAHYPADLARKTPRSRLNGLRRLAGSCRRRRFVTAAPIRQVMPGGRLARLMSVGPADPFGRAEAQFLTARFLTARENYVIPRRNSLPARDLDTLRRFAVALSVCQLEG